MAVYNQYEINNMRQDAIRRTKEMQRKSNNGYNNTGTQNTSRPMNSSYNFNNSNTQNQNRQPNSQSDSYNSGTQNTKRPMNSSYNFNNSSTQNQNKQTESTRHENNNSNPFSYFNRKSGTNINNSYTETAKSQFDNNNHNRTSNRNSPNNHGFYNGSAHGKSFPYNSTEDMQSKYKEEVKEEKEIKDPPASIGNLFNGVLNNILYD
ncbi:MAG TPA: hypothetical protein GX710_04905, partial [Clostridiales bacterium]|nr:hypothetical protein [Clostridiales bacterium]